MSGGKEFSLTQAFRFLIICTFLVSGLPWIGYGIYTYLWNLRAYDPKYEIVALLQQSRSLESLKTDFLAELLGLSIDKPINLYRFDLKEAKQKLLKFPAISEASIKRIAPGFLSIDYSLRKPIGYLGDAANTLIDKDHVLFPCNPFFSPKKLPILVIGLKENEIKWGEKIEGMQVDLAFSVLEEIEAFSLAKENQRVRVDVSYANALSLGDQKVVVTLQSENTHDILLDPVHFHEGLAYYRSLEKQEVGTAMIDLRLKQLGFIKKAEEKFK